MALNIERKDDSRYTVFVLTGRIDPEAALNLELALNQAIDTDGRHRIIVDFGGVKFLSAAGQRILLTALKKCRQFHRGDIVLVGLTKKVTEALQLTGVLEIFKICATENQAVGSL